MKIENERVLTLGRGVRASSFEDGKWCRRFDSLTSSRVGMFGWKRETSGRGNIGQCQMCGRFLME